MIDIDFIYLVSTHIHLVVDTTYDKGVLTSNDQLTQISDCFLCLDSKKIWDIMIFIIIWIDNEVWICPIIHT